MDENKFEQQESGVEKPIVLSDKFGPRANLEATNWLESVSQDVTYPYVQVIFKNTRTGFYSNPSNLNLKIGDIVAVEASPGHDIGKVAMVGPLVKVQMKKANIKDESQIKKVFRIARQADIEKFEEARAREHDTMIRSRKIAEELELNMKIGDVEYQGDGGKAIFYYIADERVDFRKLIRILADTFKVRIEMKQIGARQEAGRIGGIGPCGRPLCCASWMTHFVSVGTGAARMQDLSMNPQKLAGQCAKLKCCLNFEVNAYAEGQKKLPHKDITLETKDATYYYFKPDIMGGTVTYSTDKHIPANLVTIPAARAFEIIALNKQGIKVDSIVPESGNSEAPKKEFVELVGQDSVTRFDKSKRNKKKKGGDKEKQPAEKTAENDATRRDSKEPEPKDGQSSGKVKQQSQPSSHRDNQQRNHDNNSKNRDNQSKNRGNHPRGRNNRAKQRGDKINPPKEN